MKQRLCALLAAALLLVCLGACQSEDAVEEDLHEELPDEDGLIILEDEEAPVIQDWDGIWNNVADALGEKNKKYASDLKCIRMRGYNMSVYNDVFQLGVSSPGDLILSLHYEYVGTDEQDGVTWHLFQTNTEGDYQYLILQPVQQDGDLQYFSYRYGSESLNALREEKSWTPVMASPVEDTSQLKKLI